MDLVQAGPLFLLAAYLWASFARGTGRPGRDRRVAAAACAVAGTAALVAALSPPVLAHDEVDARVHVVQHLLLMMVGPALFALGRPVEVAVRAAPARWRGALRRARTGRVAAALGGLPVWLAYLAVMAAGFWPPLYRLQGDDPFVHGLVHAALVVLGCCYWTALVEPARRRTRAGQVTRDLAWLLAAMPVEAAIGLALADAPGPLPGAGLGATHAGGQIFWMSSMALAGTAVSLVLWRWVAGEERAATRVGRGSPGPVVSPSAPAPAPAADG